MTTPIAYTTGSWPTADELARRARQTRAIVAALVIAAAAAYAGGVVASDGSPYLVGPFAGGLVGIALFVWPRSGLYGLFAAALLLEQWGIAGLDPITAQVHFFQNVSGYADIPLRLSLADMLALLALLAWALRRAVGANEAARIGPLGWPVLAYGALFGFGMAFGIARGGAWNSGAALAELRGPLSLCIIYFLTVNLVREQRHVAILLRLLVVLTAVKAAQGLFNYVEMINGSVWLEAVTAHEDVVFFDLALLAAVAAFVLKVRGRLTLLLYCALPFVIATELVTQRRVAFIALAGGLIILAIVLGAHQPRRTLLFFGGALALFFAYAALAWDQQGILAQPIRALKGTFDPSSVSARDVASNFWREIENSNIAYTIRQLPLTGVGLGQEYLFQREPPPLTNFIYWRYMTHDAVLWVWLKAGVAGFLAFWAIIGQASIVSARLFRALPSPDLKLIALLPAVLIVIQVIFSSVDLGLTYSRNMIVLGVVLGLTAYLTDRASAPVGPRVV